MEKQIYAGIVHETYLNDNILAEVSKDTISKICSTCENSGKVTLLDENYSLCSTGEYRIYRYYAKCDNSLTDSIKEICVSALDVGNKVFFDTLTTENVGQQLVAYYKDCTNCNHQIEDTDLINFLLKGPILYIGTFSEREVFIFYKNDEIYATCDFKDVCKIKDELEGTIITTVTTESGRAKIKYLAVKLKGYRDLTFDFYKDHRTGKLTYKCARGNSVYWNQIEVFSLPDYDECSHPAQWML